MEGEVEHQEVRMEAARDELETKGSGEIRDSIPRSSSAVSILSTQTPPSGSVFTRTVDSLASVRSNKSTTFQTLANFINTHRPHIPQINQRKPQDKRPSKGSISGHLFPHTDHPNPFTNLSKSSTELASQEPEPKTSTYLFKSLKKTNASPTNGSLLSVPSTNDAGDDISINSKPPIPDKRGPPNSKVNSPVRRSARSPSFRKQREKLVLQYQFFKKFQLKSRLSDSIDYAPLRLDSMSEFLQISYDQAAEEIAKNFLKDPSQASSRSSSTTSFTRQFPEASTNPTPNPFGSQDLALANDVNNSILPPDKMRTILLYLWMAQAWKLLLKGNSIIIPQAKGARDDHKSLDMEHNPSRQICLLQNQQRQVGYVVDDEELFDESELNWIIGWQVLFDEPDYWINSVFFEDWELRPQVVFDPNSVGISANDELTHDPKQPKSPLLHLTESDRYGFLKNYSQYTTNSYKSIPLKTASQGIVYCHDLDISLRKEDWPSALAEIHRVLIPKGRVQFIMRDFHLYSANDDDNSEKPADEIWNIVTERAKREGFELQPSRHIFRLLKEAKFKDIKYTLLTLPKIVTPINMPSQSVEKNLFGSQSKVSLTSSYSDTSLDTKEYNKPQEKGKGSCSKDVKLDQLTSLITGLTEFSYLHAFTSLDAHNISPLDSDILLKYFDYRKYGDGSGQTYFDEGYFLFMVLTATSD